MAGFCTKCGTPLSSTSGFCSSCGAPIGSPVASPPPSPSSAAAGPLVSPPPVYAQPGVYGTTPAKSSGGALKIVLIVVLVIVGLGVLAVGGIGFTAWRVARAIRLNNNNGNGVSVALPGGTISAGDAVGSDADLGVPAYPGAVREKGGLNMDSASASMVMAHFSTNDSIGQVVDYYKNRMGDSTVVASTGNGTVLNSGRNDQDSVMVTVGPGNGADTGKTSIVIMHTKKK